LSVVVPTLTPENYNRGKLHNPIRWL